MNPGIPTFNNEQLAHFHPGILHALRAQHNPELQNLRLPMHAGLVKPEVFTVEVESCSPNFHLFQRPTLESVIGLGPRTDSFVLQHSELVLGPEGKVLELLHLPELDTMMHGHRYSVAVDNFSWEWLKLTGTLPANLHCLGCYLDDFDELTPKHPALQKKTWCS